MENMNKKNCFFKELIRRFSDKAILFRIILYFVIAGLIGYFVTERGFVIKIKLRQIIF